MPGSVGRKQPECSIQGRQVPRAPGRIPFEEAKRRDEAKEHQTAGRQCEHDSVIRRTFAAQSLECQQARWTVPEQAGCRADAETSQSPPEVTGIRQQVLLQQLGVKRLCFGWEFVKLVP